MTERKSEIISSPDIYRYTKLQELSKLFSEGTLSYDFFFRGGADVLFKTPMEKAAFLHHLQRGANISENNLDDQTDTNEEQ